MDFFQSQDQARQRTGRLIFFYLIAVVLIIAAVYFVVLFAADFTSRDEQQTFHFWNPRIFLWTATGTIGIITLGTAWRIHQLRAGGSQVAELMGGRKVDRSTTDLNERRLINVV